MIVQTQVAQKPYEVQTLFESRKVYFAQQDLGVRRKQRFEKASEIQKKLKVRKAFEAQRVYEAQRALRIQKE